MEHPHLITKLLTQNDRFASPLTPTLAQIGVDPNDLPVTRAGLQEEFNEIDRGHNGKISFPEFQHDFERFEVVDSRKAADIKLMFKAFDPNKDGELTLDEYVNGINRGVLEHHNTSALRKQKEL
jgi:hypothetical protein